MSTNSYFQKRHDRIGKIPIGLHFFKVEENRDSRIISADYPSFRFGYTKYRHLTVTCNLDEGRWIVIPTTEEPFLSGDFLLRFFSTSWTTRINYLVKEFPTPLFKQNFFCLPTKNHIRLKLSNFVPTLTQIEKSQYVCIVKLSEDYGLRSKIISPSDKSLVFAVKHFDTAYISISVPHFGSGIIHLKPKECDVSLVIRDREGSNMGSISVQLIYYVENHVI